MNAADILASTYNDRCDVYGYGKTVVNGVTKFKDVLKYTALECALSKESLAKVSGSNVAEIKASQKVFFRPDADIQEGDKLRITQQGSSSPRDYKAGEVFRYSGSHLEVQVTRDDIARRDNV